MEQIETLRGLGYRVEPAMHHDTDEHPTTWSVEGPGVRVHVKEDDTDAWRSLVESHQGRSLYEQLGDEDRAVLMRADIDIHEHAALPDHERESELAQARLTANAARD